MAKPVKRRIESDSEGIEATGRTTPKGTKPGSATSGGSKSSGSKPAASTRYTPPNPTTKHDLPSPMWVPIAMFSCFGVGVLMIFLNYAEVLPGSVSQWYLLGGLGAILAGIITATQLR